MKIILSSLSYLIVVLCSLILVSCGGTDALTSALKSGMNFSRAKVWIERISFKASDDMNDTSPVTLHVVVVYDAALLAEIVKLEANAYFQKIDQLKIDNAGKLDVFPFDLIRGQRLNDQTISPSKTSGEGAVIFARYASPGPHRAVLADEHAVLVELSKDDFKVSSVQN
jgi:type VI secretion system protein